MNQRIGEMTKRGFDFVTGAEAVGTEVAQPLIDPLRKAVLALPK